MRKESFLLFFSFSTSIWKDVVFLVGKPELFYLRNRDPISLYFKTVCLCSLCSFLPSGTSFPRHTSNFCSALPFFDTWWRWWSSRNHHSIFIDVVNKSYCQYLVNTFFSQEMFYILGIVKVKAKYYSCPQSTCILGILNREREKQLLSLIFI